MATTGTTRAKTSSVEAILNALRQHPDAPAAELAEAASIGRSTAGKTLATLEAQGRVTRQRGMPEGAKATPDRWTLAPDPRADHPNRAEPQPAVRGRLNVGQRQPRDVDQPARPLDVLLHQVDQVRAAGDEPGALDACGSGRGFGRGGRPLVGKGSHACLPATSAIASTMLE